MKRRLIKLLIFIFIFIINIKNVKAIDYYFEVNKETITQKETINVEIGLDNIDQNIQKALLFIKYDNNTLELNQKNIIINNNYNILNKELIINDDKTTLALNLLNTNLTNTTKLVNLEFKVKDNYYNNQTKIIFSPNIDHGYFISKSILTNEEQTIELNTKELIININETEEKEEIKHNNHFLIYFLFASSTLIIILVIIVINNMKKDKKKEVC